MTTGTSRLRRSRTTVSTERRILFNTALLGAGEGIGQLTSFCVVVSLARAFGADVLGQYSVSMAVGAVATLLVGLGTQPLLIREIGRDPNSARDLLGVLVPMQVLLGAVAWVTASLACILLIDDEGAILVIAATCGYQILSRLATTLLAPFQATERMQAVVSGQMLQRILTLAFALTAIWLGAAPGVVTLALVAGAAILIAFSWIVTSRQFGRPALRLDWQRVRSLLHLASPFLSLTALSVVYARGGLIMLSALAGPVAVGLYAVVDRCMVAASLAPGVFNSAAYPALSRLAHDSAQEARTLLVRCLRLMMVGTVPLAAMITIFADDLLTLLFGKEFLAASAALQVLAWTLPLRGAQWLLGSQLAALDQQSTMAKHRLVALAAFLVLTPSLILAFGFLGVAWAVLICDGLHLALYWGILLRIRSAPSLARSSVPPGLAAVATLLASAVATDLPLLVRAVLATAIMSASLLAFGAIRRPDLSFLIALITSGRRALADR